MSSPPETVEEDFNKLSINEEETLKNVAVATTEGIKQKKIKLIAEDGVTFEVDPFIVKEMVALQSLLEEKGDDDPVVVEISDITSHCLRQIIEYCIEHCRVAESDNAKEKLKLFDEKFVKQMNMDELKELILAANRLNMKSLLELMIRTVANVIKNKSVEFMRGFFCKENDFTPEEEEEYKKTNAWAFQNIDQD